MTLRIWTPLIASVLLGAAIVGAQPFGGRRGMLGPPPFMAALYPPRLVMQHQNEIGLQDDQRKQITSVIAETQGEITDLEWQREALAEAVGVLVSADAIDEDAVMAKASELMAVEQRIKEHHLRLLVRIKRVLSPAQRTTLDRLRPDDRRERRRERGRGPGGR